MLNFCLFQQLLLVILRVAFFTLLERKVLGYLQVRKGPNKPALAGLLVPFADALKLVTKEQRTPTRRLKFLFYSVPCLTLIIPFILWIVYPSHFLALSFKFSLLLFLCISSVGVYSLLGAGWRGNRQYAILGAVRAVAQSVSYEVRLSFILLNCVLFYYFALITYKLSPLGVFLFFSMLILVVSSFAETNRTPFDFAEGESELVRGYNTEFRSVPFVMIFLAEYIRILFIAVMVSLLFNISGFEDLFVFTALWAVTSLWSRGSLPRFRYDQLIYLAWKSFLPIVLCMSAAVHLL